MSTIPNHPPEGSLIKTEDHPHIYLVENGARRWIPDPETFEKKGYNWHAVHVLPDDELKTIPLANRSRQKTISELILHRLSVATSLLPSGSIAATNQGRTGGDQTR